ncbi:MAG: hypothetical protein HKO62_02160 [Gammaproteobacteria bacterium]|nr:hypothetical protein [Gammaproteobacteria bacterium]
MTTICRGWGLLIPLLGLFAIPTLSLNCQACAAGAPGQGGLATPLLLALAGALIWAVAALLDMLQTRVFIDLETQQRYLFRPSHVFLNLPLRWWGPLITVIAATMMARTQLVIPPM